MKFLKQAATVVSSIALMSAGVLSAHAMSSAPTGDIDNPMMFLAIGGVAIVVIGVMVAASVVAAAKRK